MTDRDRLIELLRTVDNMRLMRKGFSECADYLLANGVIVPPCKMGDTLYPIIDMSHTALKSFVSDFPIKVLPYQIYYKNIMGGISAIPFDDFGKTVFLTKEDGEKALAQLEETLGDY